MWQQWRLANVFAGVGPYLAERALARPCRMQLSFSYEVCKRNSAMYPGPDMGPEGVRIMQSAARDADPGFKRDPLWVCSLCHKPVLDDRGVPKRARSFVVAAGMVRAQKQPDNWLHCDPCRQLSREDKSTMALLASAEGTTPIHEVFVAAQKW